MYIGDAGTQKPTRLDLSPAALATCIVVILGDLAPEALTPENSKALIDFVDRGGGLIFLGGPNSLASPDFAKSPLAALLPVQLPAEYREGTYPMKITDAGLHHPVFGSLFSAIKEFPPLLTLNHALGLSPAAEVLVEADLNGKTFPAVVAMRYGQGRVVAILSDTLYHWRLADKGWKAERSPYDTFWSQLIDWLIPKEQQRQNNDRLELYTERTAYFMGEKPEIRAILHVANAKQKLPASLPLEVRTPDDKTFEYTLQAAQLTGRDGKTIPGYRVEVEPNTTGVFHAKTSVTLGGAVLEGDTRFSVVEPPSEITGKPIDREALRQMAETRGGKFYPIDNWDQWRKDLRIAEVRSSRVDHLDLWNHPILIGLLCLLLAADWATRKYRNLP